MWRFFLLHLLLQYSYDHREWSDLIFWRWFFLIAENWQFQSNPSVYQLYDYLYKIITPQNTSSRYCQYISLHWSPPCFHLLSLQTGTLCPCTLGAHPPQSVSNSSTWFLHYRGNSTILSLDCVLPLWEEHYWDCGKEYFWIRF